MSLEPGRRKAQSRLAIRYVAVLTPVILTSVVIGIFFGILTGIAAFTALSTAFLPKPGRFFKADDSDGIPK